MGGRRAGPGNPGIPPTPVTRRAPAGVSAGHRAARDPQHGTRSAMPDQPGLLRAEGCVRWLRAECEGTRATVITPMRWDSQSHGGTRRRFDSDFARSAVR